VLFGSVYSGSKSCIGLGAVVPVTVIVAVLVEVAKEVTVSSEVVVSVVVDILGLLVTVLPIPEPVLNTVVVIVVLGASLEENDEYRKAVYDAIAMTATVRKTMMYLAPVEKSPSFLVMCSK
jgi:hypothetical protein